MGRVSPLDAENAFATAFVDALARDLVRYPAQGQLARIVVRWFRHDQPLYLTVHALGTDDDDAGWPWHPLEWSNFDSEADDRMDRILVDAPLTEPAAALAEHYAELPVLIDGEYRASPAMIELARNSPSALTAAGIDLAPHFLALPVHFEGGGGLRAMELIAPPEHVVLALTSRDELPPR